MKAVLEEKIEKAVQETLDWLDKNQLAEKATHTWLFSSGDSDE